MFYARTPKVTGSNPVGTELIKIAFDFFSGTVSRLQIFLGTLGNCVTTIFSLRSLNTVPEMKLSKDMCFFTSETGEKWLQTPKSSPPLKILLDYRKG